jgi:hypothetical protein
MGYTIRDLYELKHPGAGPCPQPHRLKWFAYAMGLVAGEVEARKHGMASEEAPSQTRRGPSIEMRMPGGAVGSKPMPGGEK